MTAAYRLPCKYVIHTIGPRWQDGRHGEPEALASCYRTSLTLALENGCESVAFPLISSGIYGYPKDQALKVTMDTICHFLLRHNMTVYIVIYDKRSFQIGERLFFDIAQYIDDHYVEAYTDYLPLSWMGGDYMPRSASMAPPKGKRFSSAFRNQKETLAAPTAGNAAPASLNDVLAQIDESFSEMLLRKIDERGIKDAECYKKANIDRKLFSKIRSDKHYRPSKPTVLAFAVALELSLAETKDLLMKAGFALSRSHKFDIIVEYFIAHGNYNIFEINEALFAFDQNLLGG